jgi:hypothetical protein
MKTFSTALLLVVSGVASAGYLSLAEVKDRCLGTFARTITCSATVEGRPLRIDLDKESLEVSRTNYFEYGMAFTGFYKKTGWLGRYSRWEISCDPTSGQLTGTRYAIEHRIDVVLSVPARCR